MIGFLKIGFGLEVRDLGIFGAGLNCFRGVWPGKARVSGLVLIVGLVQCILHCSLGLS